MRSMKILSIGILSSIGVALPAGASPIQGQDPPPRRLWITVNQETSPSTKGRSAEFTVETREDGVVERRRTLTLVGGAASPDRSGTSATSTERLRVLEGHRAFVHISRAVPLPSTGTVSSAGGTVLASGKTYLDGDLAFSVVPRVTDDQVTLEITATNDMVDNRGALDVERAHITVSGRFGEWLNVGDAIRSASSPPSGILSADQRLSEVGTLLVKIDDAR